jgi:AAA+ ATPase superfamily predicted ATPase
MLNPFLPTFGNKPDKMIGRKQVIKDFVKGLEGLPGHQNRATLFIGQRGMGKTALLLELTEHAKQTSFIVARATASEGMLDKLLQLIQVNGAQYVRGDKHEVQGFEAGALGFSLGLTFSKETRENYGFHVKLMLLCDELARHGKGIVLFIDEVQSSSPEMRELTTTYQQLVGEGKNLAIAMAGLPHAISSVLSDDVLTFLNRAKHVYLESISFAQIAVYYSKVFSAANLRVSETSMRIAVEGTRGYPYLLQLVGYHLMELASDSNEITPTLASAAVNAAKDEMVATVYKPILKLLSDTDELFLKAMAQEGVRAKIGAIQARMGVSATYVQQYKQRLIENGIIATEKRGEVEFVVPYLDEYMREMP